MSQRMRLGVKVDGKIVAVLFIHAPPKSDIMGDSLATIVKWPKCKEICLFVGHGWGGELREHIRQQTIHVIFHLPVEYKCVLSTDFRMKHKNSMTDTLEDFMRAHRFFFNILIGKTQVARLLDSLLCYEDLE